MARNGSRSMDMVNGPVWKNVWIYAVPLMLTNLLQMCFNAADTIIVGRFAGQQALAAVGATGSLCFFLISVFNGLAVGANVLIARYLGAGDHAKVEKSVHTALTMAAVSGIFLTLLGFFASRPMLRLMSTPSDIIEQSELYMRIYFVGTFFGLIYNFGASVLRSKGDTQRPLYFLIASGVTNVGLNTLFVVVFHWDVAGVAIATVIAQALSAFLVCAVLIRETDSTRLDLRKLGIDPAMAWDVIKVGVPAGIQGMVFSLSNVVVQSSINSFGSSVIVAGNSAGANVESFVYIGMGAFTQATITFTSQNVGARKFDRIREIMYKTMALTVGSSVFMGVLAWLCGRFLLGFYTTDPQVIEVGMIRMTWVGLLLVLNGVLDVYVCSMRGMGYSTLPTALMIIGICGVRLAWLFFVFPHFRSLETIYLCFPISWTVTSVIQGILWIYCYRKTMARESGVSL